MFTGVAVVVPALDPTEDFPDFIALLADVGLIPVVIDDGSGASYAAVFARVESVPGVVLLRHESNRGKGRALKTGFEYCRSELDLVGVVTADSDGQHAIDDILAVAHSASAKVSAPRAVLGVRDFHQDFVPAKSAAGNRLTSQVVKVLFGRYFRDTQTGLRGFSASLLPLIVSVRGERFEYEMNALLRLVHENVEIEEVPILTVYHDATNSQTHFRPFRDSMRIYAVIFKQFFLFTSSSLAGAGADLILFTLIINAAFGGTSAAVAVSIATVGARTGSALINFVLNRQAVFHDKSSRGHGIVRYAVLAIGLVILSSVGVSVLAPALGGRVVWAKVAIDCILFIVSFIVQKRWVFADKSGRSSIRASKFLE